MEYYKDLNLENIVAEIDGVIRTEYWKPIIGYETNYHISNFGRVKSLARFKIVTPCGKKIWKEAMILKQNFTKKKYLCVGLYFEKKWKLKVVHRLVGIAFIENKDNKPQINHKNTIKTCNYEWNLEWSTNGENQRHAVMNGLKNMPSGENHFAHKLTNEQVLYIYNSNEKRITLSEQFSVSVSLIDYIKVGKIWSHITGAIYKPRNTMLSNEQILELFHSNESTQFLSDKYNVSLATVFHIKSGRNRSKLTGKVYSQSSTGTDGG